MGKQWLPYVSYSLWLLFSPSLRRETSHCHAVRGFKKARHQEKDIKILIEQDTIPQQIGHLAQIIVFEYHHRPIHITNDEIYEWIAQKIELCTLPDVIKTRIEYILNNYIKNPFLKDKEILFISRGDEGFPEPITLCYNNYQFNLFASFDCIVREDDGRINILDFKTGRSSFDQRQAFVYLVAARYQRPNETITASFYNLETQIHSGFISATDAQLNAVEIELKQIAEIHQHELKYFKLNRQDFYSIYRPSVGRHCEWCHFRSVCDAQSLGE